MIASRARVKQIKIFARRTLRFTHQLGKLAATHDFLSAANAEIVYADMLLYYFQEYRTQAEQVRNMAGGQDLDNPRRPLLAETSHSSTAKFTQLSVRFRGKRTLSFQLPPMLVEHRY